jgi:hypothetical protein
MKFNRIMSFALSVLMVFGTLAAVMPVKASAAHSPSSVTASANLTKDELNGYLTEYVNYDFNTAEEMLQHELSLGYLSSASTSDGAFTIYVNAYTGFVFYKNNFTGQILTSNPINPGYKNAYGNYGINDVKDREELMSQIFVTFYEKANTQVMGNYNSFKWAASELQIFVTSIRDGLRVNYTLGDTTARFLMPGLIKATEFEKDILTPMLERYQELLETYVPNPDENYDFFTNEKYTVYLENGSLEYGGINFSGGKKNGIKTYLADTLAIAGKELSKTSAEYKAIFKMQGDIIRITGVYKLQTPIDNIKRINEYLEKGEQAPSTLVKQLEEMYEKYPATKPATDEADDYGTALYSCTYANDPIPENKREISNIIKSDVPSYTYSMMYEDEAACGYVDNSPKKPVFRCALEYTFNEDGSLSVRMPANSITFDEAVYTLESITPLKYFGAGDMSDDGYVFFPDGSGTVVEFDDFYNEANNKKVNISLQSSIYGKDFCYSKITGTHRENITMPVYGIVSTVNANPQTALSSGRDTAVNGFFAILEQGDSLANLVLSSGGSTHKFASTYASYNPYPSDEYDLSETLSVGALGKYIIVSESKYTGSYITRYVMLSDNHVGDAVYGEGKYYESSYVGMATYYREYLKANGTLKSLELVSEDLPLYIETLGAMDVLDKFLTFPVTTTIPLTTFEDIMTMYEELSKCSEYIKSKAEDYRKLAAEENDAGQKYQYEKKAESYEKLIGKIEDISNINFRLTGFANGGMNFTYPVKAKWESAVGGRRGFEELATASKEASKVSGVNFSIFPEFDFMYIYNQKMFDGISTKGNVSKMVDNRYASKQTYNAILQEYESFFTLVISADALDTLFAKFDKQYSKYGHDKLSVSTLGSTLNSNFDEENPINRQQSQEYVTALLANMAENSGYELMLDAGNIYSVKYATHILNASLDSSHFRYSSYAVPFTGLVLHSYVNYTGTPINYSGSVKYDMLRAIENGASLYYVLCYQNTASMKDDKNLSKYYGVDYENWYASILEVYTELNGQIGRLQGYEIVDHKTLLAERVIEEEEMLENYKLLEKEVIELLDKALSDAVDKAHDELRGNSQNYGKRVKLSLSSSDRAALISQFAQLLNVSEDSIKNSEFGKEIEALIVKYETEYAGSDDAQNNYNVSISEINYESRYSYITDSTAFDDDYVYTKYTSDNGNVVMVTYKKGNDVVRFLLNYNIYPVNVRLDDNTVVTLDSYDYEPLD